jgi:hypothetical protein
MMGRSLNVLEVAGVPKSAVIAPQRFGLVRIALAREDARLQRFRTHAMVADEFNYLDIRLPSRRFRGRRLLVQRSLRRRHCAGVGHAE